MLLPGGNKNEHSNGNMTGWTPGPGLPVANPTTPMWQVPLHELADVSSSSLPEHADVVVIGSGMTGCSVTKTLLEGDPKLKVTVLEARGLASGASSRNGGHIVSPSFGDFTKLVETLGLEMAVKVASFTAENCEKTFEMVDALPDPRIKERSEIRRTEKIIALGDESIVGEVRKLIKVWNESMPAELREGMKLISGQEAEEKYGILNVAGAAVGRAAAVWPYRLWTGVWEHLLQTYPDRLTVETFTPALSINRVKSMDGEPLYRISTPKCDIQASKVVYCSNGFTGHLLPALQGKIFPWRGTMSCQDLGPSFPNVGAERSWSFISESKIDPELGVPNAGLYYLTQNGKTGHMFLGGENEALENILTSDDSQLNPNSAKKIGKVLPTLFKDAKDPPQVEKIWSGIMGFTKDGLPLVGPLPEFVTGRPTHDGEYIAAGFNGYGTGYCFLCGKAVGEMILGKNTDWMPAVFLVTEERFEGGLVSSRFHGHLLP